jgi:hypothetical protein
VARYYLDKDLVITGIIPGSMVGVWYDPAHEIIPTSRNLQEEDRRVFVGRVDDEQLTVPVSNREGSIFIRIRREHFRTFETPFYLNGSSDGVVSVRQQRDF